MRRLGLIPILTLVLCLATASCAEATFYTGRGDGIRVTFRVKGNKVTDATFHVRLYCKGNRNRRHLNRAEKSYAWPDEPLRLNRRGIFRYDTRAVIQEEGYSQTESLIGHVSHDFVVGRFEYLQSENWGRHHDRTCQSGSYPYGNGEMKFRASRRRS
jgi:hypothetical protein